MILLSICLLPGFLSAQEINPYTNDSRAVSAGGVLFRANCATCHGAEGKGIQDINAPALTELWSRDEVSDASVFATVREGIPGSIMPPHSLPDREIWMIVAYLRSLGATDLVDVGIGDPEAGAMVFSRQCANCHLVRGEGGSLGPELTNITAVRSEDYLRQALRAPSETIRNGYRSVEVVTKDGETVRGILKNEDAFSVQLLDLRHRLRTFDKRQLRSLEKQSKSLMPVFTENQLGPEDLDNLFSFIGRQTK